MRLENDRWVWNVDGVRRVPYRLPELLDHIAENRREPIYIVEGEKDVEAIRAVGGIATCNPGGAGKWRDEYAEALQGARRVVILADRDETGRRHAVVVFESLASVGVFAELVEAAEGKDAADHLAAGRLLDELVPIEHDRPAAKTAVVGYELRIVSAADFAVVEEPSAEPLLGEADEVVVAADSLTVFYGDGGAGKTTLAIDFVTHLASGTDWLGFSVPRPVRVLLIENEGPRGLFRRKLRRKIAGWSGTPWADNVFVLEEPWARASFADEDLRSALASELDRLEIDLVVAGPVKRLGMEGGGTPDEVSRFHDLIVRLRSSMTRPLAVLLVHHENKAGGVSGAWAGEPDTLVHVRAESSDRTVVKIEKARWASSAHGSKLTLTWADAEGFALFDAAERAKLTDSTYEQRILDYLAEHPWTETDDLTQHVEGRARELRRARQRLQEAGRVTSAPSAAVGHPGQAMRWNLSNQAASSPVPLFGTPPDGAPSEPVTRNGSVPPSRPIGQGDRTDGVPEDATEVLEKATLADPDRSSRDGGLR